MDDIKNSVVAVLVDGTLRGTGYLATDRLVITCAHVLTDDLSPPEEEIVVRFYCNGAEVRVETSEERWSPSSKDDVAVLELRLEPGESLPAGARIARLARSSGRRNRQCEVFGYPNVATFDGLGGRATVIENVRDLDGR